MQTDWKLLLQPEFEKPYFKKLGWLFDFALPLNWIFEEIEIDENTVEEINKRCFVKNSFVSPKSDGLTIFFFIHFTVSDCYALVVGFWCVHYVKPVFARVSCIWFWMRVLD